MNFAAKAANAGSMIRRNGNGLRLTLTRVVQAVDAEGKPTGAPVETSGTFDAIVFPYEPPRSESFASGTLLRESHRKALFAADTAPFDPLPGDTLRFEGVPWRVAPGSTTLRPDGVTAVLHTLLLEK